MKSRLSYFIPHTSYFILLAYLICLPIYCLLRVFGLDGPVQVMTFVIPVVLCAFSVAHAIEMRGFKTALLFFASGASISLGTELIGTTTGLLFGNYTYTERMGYKLFGHVPWLIPVAWCSMLYPAWCVSGYVLRGASCVDYAATPTQHAIRITLASLALTAWDLSLDPRMVQDGNWVWHDGGFYFGVPLSNYVGWVVTAGLVYGGWGIVDLRMTNDERRLITSSFVIRHSSFANLPVWAYIFVWLGESVANVLFWAGPGVGLCVFVGMGVFAVPALRRLVLPTRAQWPARSPPQAAEQ
jgi:putative membrane protein